MPTWKVSLERLAAALLVQMPVQPVVLEAPQPVNRAQRRAQARAATAEVLRKARR